MLSRIWPGVSSSRKWDRSRKKSLTRRFSHKTSNFRGESASVPPSPPHRLDKVSFQSTEPLLLIFSGKNVWLTWLLIFPPSFLTRKIDPEFKKENEPCSNFFAVDRLDIISGISTKWNEPPRFSPQKSPQKIELSSGQHFFPQRCLTIPIVGFPPPPLFSPFKQGQI